MTRHDLDLVVVGLGAMGSATADAAARAGHRVLGLEAFAPGHANGSSHGPTRILRRSVEEGPHYVPLVLDAIERWDQLAAETDGDIFVRSGAIRIAPAGSPLHEAFVTSAVAHRLEFDRLDAGEIRRDFPGFAVPDGHEALFESEAGVLFADRAIRALQRRASLAGAALHFDEPVRAWSADGSGALIVTDRQTYRAEHLVITAGAWTNRVATGLGLPLTPHRVVNVSFAPKRPELYGADRLPAFIVSDGTDGAYGVPAVEGEGVKVGAAGTPTDPDRVDRTINGDDIRQLRRWVERFLPHANGPVAATLSCLYTVAPDGEFVIGRHPEHPQVVVATPCSGHGFKYTTAIGPLLVELAFTGSTRIPIDRFALDRFAAATTASGEQK